jgi:hypothetical protein
LVSAHTVVDAALAKLGVGPEWRAVTCWREVCGPTIAQKTQPERVHGGVLYVRVASSSWLHELSYVKAELLARLRSRAKLALCDIKFQVGKVVPLPGEARPAMPHVTPIDAISAETVAHAAERIADPELADVLRRLGLGIVRAG